MQTYLNKYDLSKGINGESGPEDIQDIKNQFEKLVNFSSIDHPFQNSI